jgi:polyhydroxybutyrate depolymerase
MLKKLLFFLIILPLVGISIYMGLSVHRSKEVKVDYAGLTRKYRIHYPAGFDENKKYPLVLALHGYKDDARIMEIYTSLSRKADKEGFIVVYPYAYKDNFFTLSSWNAGFCCGWAYENKIDDLGVVGQGNVDEKKIYVVGMSNGAMLSSLFTLKHADKIAAQAVVAGAVGAKYEEDEEFTSLEKTYVPVPTIILHGKSDKTIPFDGGHGSNRIVDFTGAYDTLSFWLDNNKCTNHPTEVSKQGAITKEVYKSCENSEILFYAVESGHGWPGGLSDFANLVTKRSIAATDIVWDFLSSN